MDKEIKSFVEKIGAKAPDPRAENFRLFKSTFPRPNYFILEKHITTIKISRSKKPFWGLSKKSVDLFNNLENYFLVLLDSDISGWFFNKVGINSKIKTREWNLQDSIGEYKINYNTVKYDNSRFTSPNQFLKMVRNI